jgi:hypothetical protein
LLLALAVLALVFQIWPPLWYTALWIVDVRNWPQWVWLWLNLGVVFVLVGVRFGPQLRADWRVRRERLATERARQAKEREMREQREMLERIEEGRKRRIM